MAAVLALGVAVVPLVHPSSPPAAPSPTESSAEVAARNVRDCQRDHGLGQAREKRATRPGETDISAPDPLPEFAVFEQVTYASCSWPPPPGGNADGYRAITLTEVDGPGGSEADGVAYADRIESRCAELEVSYMYGSQGSSESQPPFRARPAQILRSDGSTWTPMPLDDNQDGTLPFYPARDELVVLHNSKRVLDAVDCVS